MRKSISSSLNELLSRRTNPNVPNTDDGRELAACTRLRSRAPAEAAGENARTLPRDCRTKAWQFGTRVRRWCREGNGGTFLQICLVREIERINLEFLAPGGALLSGGSLLPVLIDAQSPDLGFQSLAWYPEFRGCSCRSGNPSMGPGESSFDHLHFTIFQCR